MPRYLLTSSGSKFSITADSPREAREQASRKVEKATGVRVPPREFYVRKEILEEESNV